MNKTKNKLMPLMLLTAGILTFTGCTDSNYDFDKVDATMGFGGESIEIPFSSTQEIPLEDILELQQDGSVKTDADGNYLFQLAGNEVEGASPKIAPIFLYGEAHPIDLTIFRTDNYSKLRSAIGTIEYTSNKEKMFQYSGRDKSIVDLQQATIDEATLQVVFKTTYLSQALDAVDQLTIRLPKFIDIESVTADNGQRSFDNSVVTISNISTAKDLNLAIKLKNIDFTKDKNDEYGSLYINKNNGNIDIEGFLRIGVKANIARIPTDNLRLIAEISASSTTLRKATGIFDPDININSLGEVNVTGIPDFLSEDDVVADVDNPVIILNVANNMDAAANITATIVSTKNGAELARVDLPKMKIHKSSVSENTKICICRKSTNSLTSQYGAENVYEVSNLSTLIQRIPDHISIENVKAQADLTQTAVIEFGKTYSVKPSYEIYAPLAFGEKANIVYTDTFKDWNDDIKDLDLAEGTYIMVTANAENKVPAYLTVTAYPIDAQGNEIKDKLTIEIPEKVQPSTDGETAVITPITMKISAKEKNAFKSLDGLTFRISGSASTEGEASVTGVTLNAKKHSIKLNDIKVKIVGKVIGDFN